MNPREFQELAQRLVLIERPAETRTAISRAYYSVYNFVVQMLKEIGFEVSEGPSGHGDAVQKLSNCGSVRVQRVGSQLSVLRSKRIQADYRLDRRDVEISKTAQAIVIQAGKMIKELDECCTGPEREEIVKGIKDYLSKLPPRF
jgi:hypothetical protein